MEIPKGRTYKTTFSYHSNSDYFYCYDYCTNTTLEIQYLHMYIFFLVKFILISFCFFPIFFYNIKTLSLLYLHDFRIVIVTFVPW